MRCVTLSCLAAIAICLTANAAADDLASAEQLVAQLDRVRQPARSYLADVTVSEFRSGRRERDATFRIYCRKVSNGFDVLALCLTPLRDSGKLFLASSDKLWFYDPRSARPVPIAPNQARTHELLFDALGDSLASQYSARVEGEELTADLARRQ